MAARPSEDKLQELLGTLKTEGVETLDRLMDAYEERRAERANRQKAVLRYVTPPTAGQLEQIRDFLRKKYNDQELPLELIEDPTLLGGFSITVGSDEYDWSMKGRLTQMKNRLLHTPQMLSDSSEVIDLLRTEIDSAAFDGKDVPGTWNWKAGQAITNATDTGSKAIVFTPADLVNYHPVEG